MYRGRTTSRKVRRFAGRGFLRRALAIALWALVALFGAGHADARGSERMPDGRLRVTYWEKWTDFERAAMQAVVDDYNRSQNRVYVDFLSISAVNQKTLIATAGGNPPDLAGVWATDVVDFADKEALIPLDEYARGSLVDRERFIPVYWDMGVYEGKLYGVPSTPVSSGLHWNKRLFREAGLDPERPPHTIAELDEYSKRLTRVEDGKLVQAGFMPSQPPWWPFFWPYFFGGELWDGGEHVLLDRPENVRAFEWVQGYAKVYGVSALQTMSAGFGNFASAQNPFMSEKVAMMFHGVFLANYVAQYAPHVEWGAAPFPVLKEGDRPVTFLDTDVLVIPRGSPHPEEAFEFIEFVTRQSSMEKLCLGQRKNSPLRDVSEEFYAKHKHPYIHLFQDLPTTARGYGMPQMGVWAEYRSEIENVFQRVWLLQATPEQALHDGKVRIQKSWDRARVRKAVPQSKTVTLLPFGLIGILVAAVVALGVRERRRTLAVSAARSVRSNVSLSKGLLFVSPWIVGLLLFSAYPVMASLVYSFCDYSVLSPPRWVGLQNFVDLFQDEVFLVALRNTLYYTVFALPLGLVAAFGLAALLDTGVRGSGVYRTLVFLPSLTPVVASAMVWLWIFNAQYGVLNDLIGRLSFGLIDPVPWLVDPKSAMPSLILMSVWSVGQTVVILLAAMQDVPSSMYEAADIDGATLWQKLRHITIPLISPVIYFNAILGTIGALQVFAQPYIMTGGGPTRATLSYTMRLYDNAFKFLRMGYASAMAWILFLIILGLTALAIRVGRRRVHYAET